MLSILCEKNEFAKQSFIKMQEKNTQKYKGWLFLRGVF